MKTKYISACLATGLLSLGASSSWAESSSVAKLNFSCQNNQGIPTTVAQKSGSETVVPVFHWKNEALPTSMDAKQLCDRVSAKLEDYSAQDYDLSTLGFSSAEQAGLPAICATGKDNGDCSLVLFTLAPTDNPVNSANEVLDAILDRSLQSNKHVSSDRGVQSISYQVNLWDILGLKLIQ